MLRKPPEQYRTKVGILKNVMVDYHTSSTKIKSEEQPIDQIKDAAIRMNKIVIYVYQFIKAYYLYLVSITILSFLTFLMKTLSVSVSVLFSDIQEKRGTGLNNTNSKKITWFVC